jgi:hypothetical protein
MAERRQLKTQRPILGQSESQNDPYEVESGDYTGQWNNLWTDLAVLTEGLNMEKVERLLFECLSKSHKSQQEI